MSGTELLVVSHGVGSAGAAICFNELIAIGVKCIIRAGTCGSLQTDQWKQGDVCIAYAAGKEDGVSRLMEPQGMPAVATPSVTNALSLAAAGKARLGVTVSSDIFYAPKVLPGTLGIWRDCQVDVIDMEVSTLFTICRGAKVMTGAVLAVDGSPFGWEGRGLRPEQPQACRGQANHG